jgi:hypothetical protein
MGIDRRESVLPALALGHDLHIGERLEKSAHPPARHLFVVGEKNPQWVHASSMPGACHRTLATKV